jgi:ATP-dependent Clp protease ATP-binding subunit ClpB
MTSNLGSQYILDLADDSREMERRVMQAVHQHLRPEFLNRVDEIVVFHPLGKEELRKIVDLNAEHLRKMLADRGITLELTPAARDALAEEGYDPSFGARPLKRTIQRRLQNPLAMKILSGEFKPGQTVEVDHERGEFVFRAGARERVAV